MINQRVAEVGDAIAVAAEELPFKGEYYVESVDIFLQLRDPALTPGPYFG